jgi:selenocysteine lyase/cysteine desulfurase
LSQDRRPQEAFAVPKAGPYLLAHSVGCITHEAVRQLQSNFVDPVSRSGAGAWPQWLDGVDQFRHALARFFGGLAAEYCPQPSVSAGLANVLSAIPQQDPARRVWLASEDAFPSIGFVLQQAHRLGYELRLIPRHRRPDDLETWADAIQPDVCGVLITHVHFNSGRVSPVRAIAELCRARGATSVLDVAQSAGIVPIDVHALGVDIMLGSCVKWLCGGPGAGFLWIRQPLLATMNPSYIGWFSHEAPFEFDIRSYRHAPDALRFWGGTPSIAPYVMAAASLGVLQEIGIDTLISHNRRLTEAMKATLPHDWQDTIPKHPIGGTLCLDLGGELEGVQERLTAAGVQSDHRGSVLRISFHIWNTAEEVALVAQSFPRRATRALL